MYVDKKILIILALTVSAIALVWATVGHVAKADNVIVDRDYQLITAHSGNGGDDLYVYDGNSGILAVFVYDPNTQGLRPRAFRPVGTLFGPPQR
jgi:hypothetical protein